MSLLRRLLSNRGAAAGLAALLLLACGALLAPNLSPHGRDEVNLRMRLRPPGTLDSRTGHRYLLGTDLYGRDLATRVLYGGRVSLMVGLAAAALSLSVGLAVGAIAGYFGGRVDGLIMRVVDLLLCVPLLPLVLTLLAVLGQSVGLLVLVLGLGSWMETARLVRGEVLSLREREYVAAARASGATGRRVICRHLLPNLTHILMTAAALQIAGAMLAETTLSFLGLGVQPPVPSWGNILYEHQNYQFLRSAPWTSLAPGGAVFLATLSLYLVADGLRDALDPQIRA